MTDTTPAHALLTFIDSTLKLPLENIDEIPYSSPLPVYLIALDQSTEQRKRFERELSHLPRNLTATIHLEQAPAVTIADLKSMLERKSSFLNKANQHVHLELPTTRKQNKTYELAHTLSHLKAIQQAYGDGHESVLIVEDSAVMHSNFFRTGRLTLRLRRWTGAFYSGQPATLL